MHLKNKCTQHCTGFYALYITHTWTYIEVLLNTSTNKKKHLEHRIILALDGSNIGDQHPL